MGKAHVQADEAAKRRSLRYIGVDAVDRPLTPVIASPANEECAGTMPRRTKDFRGRDQVACLLSDGGDHIGDERRGRRRERKLSPR